MFEMLSSNNFMSRFINILSTFNEVQRDTQKDTCLLLNK